MPLISSPELQFFNTNGSFLTGGSLYTYTPGTYSFYPTYQDYGMTQLNTNPIILNAYGQCSVFATGNIRYVLFDSLNNQLMDQVTTDGFTATLNNMNTSWSTSLNNALSGIQSTLTANSISLTSMIQNETSRAELAETNLANMISFATNFFSGLVSQITSATQIVVSATQLILSTGSGQYLSIPLSATINTGATGIGGLDYNIGTSLGSSTWYYIYAISNGTTAGAVLSANYNGISNQLSSSYPYFMRIGSATTTSLSGGLVATIQYGRRTEYVVGGANMGMIPLMASGKLGSPVTGPTWAPIYLNAYIPPVACAVDVVLAGASSSATVMIAPNPNYGVSGNANEPPIAVHGSSSTNVMKISKWLFIENTQQLYYASNDGAGAAYVAGWEENL
jgi:hypothetical protein